MLLSFIRNGFSRDTLIMVLLSVPVILIALTVHEFSHALAAKLLGDPTARNMGRLSLNPLKHLDPIGSLLMLFCGFGWARPVPINSRNFRSPKWGMAISALAGPVSNFILSFIGSMLYYVTMMNVNPGNDFLFALALFFRVFAIMNLSLAIFNFLPIPPLDGSRILFVFLPGRAYFAVMKYERVISIAIIVLVFTGILTKPLGELSIWILGLFDSVAAAIFG